MEELLLWYCRNCGVNAVIETFESRLGERYVCKHCGIFGKMSDEDSPVKVTSEEMNLYWFEFQNDKTFQPPQG